MPDSGNPDAGLYPQPVQPQQNALNNPLQLLGAMQQVNALRQFNATQAAGRAAQGALNPDGTIDLNRYSTGLQNPDVAPVGQQAVGTMLEQRQQQISNSTNALGLATNQNQALLNVYGPIANNPNAKPEDVYAASAQAARMGIPGSMITPIQQGILSDPKGIHTGAQKVYSQQLGTSGATQVTGSPTTEGAPTQVGVATAGFGAGPRATDLPPGQHEAIAANQAAFVNDQQAASAKFANIRPLQNALPLISQLSNTSFGPGSAQFNQVKAGLITAGIIPADTADVAVRQEVNKYLNVYASAARGADRSDQGLNQALHSNPGLDLTQPANLALVKNQIGMDRMDAAAPIAFNGDKAQYNSYKSTYYQNNDPRAFSFDLMTPQERTTLLAKIGPKNASNPAWVKFNHSLGIARNAAGVTPDATGAPQNGP
jgi:hypothetical protein